MLLLVFMIVHYVHLYHLLFGLGFLGMSTYHNTDSELYTTEILVSNE